MAGNLQIPLLDLRREYRFLKKDIDRELKRCFLTQRWILGEKVGEFEQKAAAYLGAKYAIGVGSGTDALLLSLRALAIKLKKKEFFDKKDEIITTPLTFIATAEAIVRSGATPVFVDIDLDTFNVNPKEIVKAVGKNTVGILPVHLYGLACNMDEIMKIARENKLFVVEDTAQAFGGEYHGKKLGTIGDCGAFSFFPSKNLGAYGDGGLVATNNNILAELVKTLRNHGQGEKYNAIFLGQNSRLDSLQAAVLLAKLRYIDRFNELRRRIAKKYNEAFDNIKQVQLPRLSSIEGRTSGIERNHVYHLYTLKILERRGALINYLKNKGIESRVYYPFSLDKMSAFKNGKIGLLTHAKAIASKILTLPLHPFLHNCEVEFIIKSVLSFFKKQG